MHSVVPFFSFSLAFLAALAPQVRGHSWVEQLMVIGPDQFYVGKPGYPRGYVARSPSFSDAEMQNLIPPNGRENKILPDDSICRPSQSTPNQPASYPALKAAPGSFVALRYQENGHVSLPANTPGKPDKSGVVHIYGTTEPQPTDSLLGVLAWNKAGSGGDRRGKLLASQTFDDGQCYQVNGGTISQQRQQLFPHAPTQLMGRDLWCQNNIKLPDDAVSGKPYTLYWVWDWRTAPNVDPGIPGGKFEFYTTCMDVHVTTDVTSEPEPKDISNRAIPSLMDGL